MHVEMHADAANPGKWLFQIVPGNDICTAIFRAEYKHKPGKQFIVNYQ